MIPLPPPKPVLIEPEFWALVRAFEKSKIGPTPPIPLLRGFVEIGHLEARAESAAHIEDLRFQLSAALRQIRSLERRCRGLSQKRRAVWESKILSGPGIGSGNSGDGCRKLRDMIKEGEKSQIIRHLKSGCSIRETARRMQISVATLYRRFPKASHRKSLDSEPKQG